ncbi:hypothetical protein KSD_32180 [Ktedonobacter sp. SOSP1-85]|nr:hypothetical protein KSD_32180 [Ktedonobacter sp. SOSP1-85]
MQDWCWCAAPQAWMASNVDNVSYADTSPGLPGFVLALSYHVATLVALYLAGVDASNASM